MYNVAQLSLCLPNVMCSSSVHIPGHLRICFRKISLRICVVLFFSESRVCNVVDQWNDHDQCDVVLHMYLLSKVLEADLHVLFHFHIEF